MAGRAGPTRKVTVRVRMVVEYECSEWRCLDETREEFADGYLYPKMQQFPISMMGENINVVSFEKVSVKGSKETKK